MTATSIDGVTDIVSIRDLQVSTVIGVYDWEREIEQALTFSVDMAGDVARAASRDAELRVYEPSVSWTLPQLFDLAGRSGLRFRHTRTYPMVEVTPPRLWHWVWFTP